jgi:phosphopantothenoylcysteine decarboxylase/phosphopantothenate--cysteine ligase
MQSLSDKRILLCVSAGIAAYKCCDLVRRLADAGATVQVAMTPRATAFVTPLTLQALTGRPVRTELFDNAAEAAMGHIELARWADAVLIAPATADVLARLAHGMADDLVTTLCLATTAPVHVAPAMNHRMWLHPATQANLATLRDRGVTVHGPGDGAQACGEFGPGRMAEPADIVAALMQGPSTASPTPPPATKQEADPAAATPGVLAGRTVVITAGPTREALDPVRYISNHSSGKQGFALAEAARDAGARVVLIAGPVGLPTPPGIRRVDVVSARDMHAAALREAADCDLFIAVAAVADYRPRTAAETKIKKAGDGAGLVLELVENPDIVASIGALPRRPFIVGFAAETDNVLANARSKRARKKMDFIVLNDVADQSIGFSSDDNAVTLIGEHEELTLAKAPKAEISRRIIGTIAQRLGVPAGPGNGIAGGKVGQSEPH